jgi:CRISPR-associated protein Cas6
MYWEEPSNKDAAYVVPDNILDLSFRVTCRSLPVDHAHLLSEAVQAALSWFADESAAGVHLIHGAESGNGWMRPGNPGDLLHLSRRTRFTLRLPKERVAAARALSGQSLNIGDNELRLGAATERPLSPLTTLFARHVIGHNAGEADDQAFLATAAERLQALGISVRKMMSGRLHTIATPRGKLVVRSLMVAGMEVEDSVRLQQQGLGEGRKLGCGLFIPHKGIDAVKDAVRR